MALYFYRYNLQDKVQLVIFYGEKLSLLNNKPIKSDCIELFLKIFVVILLWFCDHLFIIIFQFLLILFPLQYGWLFPPEINELVLNSISFFFKCKTFYIPFIQKSMLPENWLWPRKPAFVWIICTCVASSRVNLNDFDPCLSTNGAAGSKPKIFVCIIKHHNK